MICFVQQICGLRISSEATHSSVTELNRAGSLVLLMATNENLPPNVIKQLAKELKNLDETPPEGIKVVVDDGDFSTIHADIDGPAGTPYENGIFRMKLILSRDFPHSPPKGYFMTKIFHPNISSSGEICVNTLKKDWNPSLGLRHVLTVVRCLLIEPFPESALNEQAGKLLLEDYEQYARHARLYTGIHAKPKPKFKSGAITESTTALNVDQTNTSVLNADSKTVPSNAALPPLSTPSTTAARGASQDLALGVPTESSVNCSTASAVASAAPAPQKKEIRTAKAQADKKKLDARKKSLKRL
ncbi:Ubiquitin-conjugating enzyme E2 22 [Trifolium repens]|nr:Ubiquitin-conjugating enzyme E2 22 [Trifolium repens]